MQSAEMEPSPQFLELTVRLIGLREALLPSSQAVNPSDHQIRAYGLLAQSEIAAYLEARSSTLALLALDAWKRSWKASRVLVSLFAYSGLQWERPVETLELSGEQSLGGLVERASLYHLTHLTSNPGTSAREILQLLVPVGVRYEDLDPYWLNTVQSFSATVKEYARASGKARQLADLSREVEDVILRGLKDVDALLTRLQEEVSVDDR